MADDVDQLLEQLKALPLIDSADLTHPFAAYDSFELVLSAILRAALAQVPPTDRRGRNRQHFRAFVCQRFPPERGRNDVDYADRLWDFRTMFVKEKRTAGFVLVHDRPDEHLAPGVDGRPKLNLQSLIADFRLAVDQLGPILRASDELRQLAADEVARRTVHVTSAPSFTQTSTVLFRGNTLGAKATSGTN